MRALRSDIYIDGTWRPGSNGDRFPVTNPADASTIAEFAIATDDDCDARTPRRSVT
jgi:succinate-semialdehyde dehydrogenase/glutarate-semialdehyde dehydrogenase